jgi:hypothetical protein
MSSVFSVEFSSTLWSRPGLLWTPEWVTLVEEHCGVEAARQVLLLLLRRAKCKESDFDIIHTCCHRGNGIPGRRRYENRPQPLTAENIAGIQEDESEFIDILEDEIEKLASESLHCLWSEWMFTMKAEYDAHVIAMDKERAEYKPPLPMVSISFTMHDRLDDQTNESDVLATGLLPG